MFNLINLVTKRFILYCKWKKFDPSIIALQMYLKKYYMTELYIARGNEKKINNFKKKWGSFGDVVMHL